MKQEKKDAGKKKQHKGDIAQRIVENVVRLQEDSTDPQGSYTGRPVDREERPVQDADDL